MNTLSLPKACCDVEYAFKFTTLFSNVSWYGHIKLFCLTSNHSWILRMFLPVL